MSQGRGTLYKVFLYPLKRLFMSYVVPIYKGKLYLKPSVSFRETWSYVTHGLCVSGLHGVSRQGY
jgi:hypothetical protein